MLFEQDVNISSTITPAEGTQDSKCQNMFSSSASITAAEKVMISVKTCFP